jgi:hypothetical protein
MVNGRVAARIMSLPPRRRIGADRRFSGQVPVK